jgi:CBS-domain-containing membrane protein
MLEIMFIMASISLIMVIGHFAHPPAAATALLPAMGYLTGFTEAIGLIVSTALLAFEAYVFNRLLGGLPYPRWHSDSTVSIRYGRLGGSPPSDPDESYAEALQKNLFAPKTDDSASKD